MLTLLILITAVCCILIGPARLVSLDPGIAVPGSLLIGLKIFDVIAFAVPAGPALNFSFQEHTT